jgi:nicotinamide-nucleotide amidase
MPNAEIITIGTEILLGEIVDTNTRYIARKLRDNGINLFRTMTVGDNVDRIANILQESMHRADIIITTGGLGPTVDDPTREAAARAAGVTLEYHPELWEQIEERFRRYGRQPTENNRRQAYLPQGALTIENPVGTAPCFILEKAGSVIISLPGVPREMEFILERTVLPYLKERFHVQGLIKARVLHTAGVGESQIDDLVGDLETLTNPTVGLAAHSGQVDVRITAKADSETEADLLIAQVEADLRQRLGEWIYGIDEETLERICLDRLHELGWTLVLLEAGLGGALVNRMAGFSHPLVACEMVPTSLDADALQSTLSGYRKHYQADVALGISMLPGATRQDVLLLLITPMGQESLSRPYGGAPANAPRWGVNHGLNLIRNL